VNRKKVWISIAVAAVVIFTGVLSFVIIPRMQGRFRPVRTVPTTITSVSGNGGAAVMVGQYLYFTSGFISMHELEYRQNDYNRVRRPNGGDGAIWRVRMDNGLPVYDNSHLEAWEHFRNGTEQQFEYWDNASDLRLCQDREKGSPLELIVPKVAGWEETALWVVNGTLIYTSPNNQRNRHGQLRRERTDFFRVDLDGRNHRRIYTTRNDNVPRADFTVVYGGDGTSRIHQNVYLMILDGEQLNRVDMRGRVHTVAEDVTSVVLPIVTGYFESTIRDAQGNLLLSDARASRANSFGGIMRYVFFTQNCDDELHAHGAAQNNIVGFFNISSRKTRTIFHNHNSHALLALGNGHLVMETGFQDPARRNELKVISGVNEILLDHYGNDSGRGAFTGVRTMASPLLAEQGEAVMVAGELSELRLITRINSQLFLYSTNQTLGQIYTPITLSGAHDVDEIIAINSNNIMFRSLGGDLVTVTFAGERQETELPPTRVQGARVSAFQVLNRYGQSSDIGHMFFFINEISEILDDAPVAENEESEPSMPETLTIGVITSHARGSFFLTYLDDNFIPWPPTVDEN